jgi:site-specific DNA recombinase
LQSSLEIPARDQRLVRGIVDTAKEMVKNNRRKTNKGRRDFELGGVLYCGGCGKKMQYSASPAKGRIYSYYKCRRVLRDGRDACPAGADRPNHRAKELEQRVWEFVFELMKSPERLREDLERMIEIEREGRYVDPKLETKAWLEKLAEVAQERRGYLRLAAKGHMTDEDLDRELGELEKTRRTAERELEAIRNRQERVELLERDKDEILDSYTRLAPEALDGLSPEERHRLYRMLRLKVIINPDRSLEVSGALETELVQLGFVQPETVPR